MSNQEPNIRIGHGFDLHRLAPLSGAGERGRPMVLGGVRFVSEVGPVGHSDGDALLHAITDAILGALALPDIGQLFPDTDPKWAGANSEVFLKEAMKLAAGWRVSNLDATVILEKPKLGTRKEDLRKNIARILGIEELRVNVKGKTHERVDAVGEGRAVEVHAVVVMVRAVG
jgi:2-C-methyl-D-erythritol 2,4-cyclodiphosphate synthase